MNSKRSTPFQLESVARVKLQNIRDRWLLNSRSVDYESFVKSAFMLLQSKKDGAFAQRTQMLDMIVSDFKNLDGFIE